MVYTFNPEILNKPFELGYICGLLATDGNLHDRDKCISLALHKDDEETIRYFGTCEIHKNSTFKCISGNVNEIDERFKKRIQVVH